MVYVYLQANDLDPSHNRLRDLMMNGETCR